MKEHISFFSLFTISIKGGPGSGNWSHVGRPGKRGGSGTGGGLIKNPKALGRYRVTAGSESTRKQAIRIRQENPTKKGKRGDTMTEKQTVSPAAKKYYGLAKRVEQIKKRMATMQNRWLEANKERYGDEENPLTVENAHTALQYSNVLYSRLMTRHDAYVKKTIDHIRANEKVLMPVLSQQLLHHSLKRLKNGEYLSPADITQNILVPLSQRKKAGQLSGESLIIYNDLLKELRARRRGLRGGKIVFDHSKENIKSIKVNEVKKEAEKTSFDIEMGYTIKDTKKQTVEGYKLAGTGIHKTEKGDWSLTHIKSGLSLVSGIKDEKTAFALLKASSDPLYNFSGDVIDIQGNPNAQLFAEYWSVQMRGFDVSVEQIATRLASTAQYELLNRMKKSTSTERSHFIPIVTGMIEELKNPFTKKAGEYVQKDTDFTSSFGDMVIDDGKTLPIQNKKAARRLTKNTLDTKKIPLDTPPDVVRHIVKHQQRDASVTKKQLNGETVYQVTDTAYSYRLDYGSPTTVRDAVHILTGKDIAFNLLKNGKSGDSIIEIPASFASAAMKRGTVLKKLDNASPSQPFTYLLRENGQPIKESPLLSSSNYSP